ncbi:DUF1196 domain-containing protein, partial [Vibrio cholerae]|nr:DUF1196 domain-containing protein [Vibrio cholerae]
HIHKTKMLHIDIFRL